MIFYQASGRQVGFGIDWTLVNQAAVDWARGHAGELVNGITETARNYVGEAIGDYFENGLTIGDLRERLERVYGPKKAEEIAQTEVTRAAVEGEVEMVDEIRKAGIEMTPIWQTNNDDLVCPICGPMNGKKGRYEGSVPRWEHPDLGEIGAPPAQPLARPRQASAARYPKRRERGHPRPESRPCSGHVLRQP